MAALADRGTGMGDMSKEPSMEEILSSIKRIIAEEGEEALQAAPRRGRAKAPVELGVPASDAIDLEAGDPEGAGDGSPADGVLELTEQVGEEEIMAAPKTPRAPRAGAATATAGGEEGILSVASEIAARQSLSSLSSLLVGPRDGEDNTLDGLVRSMLRPMLKEWLDARLPALVEEMVAKEIARIAGR